MTTGMKDGVHYAAPDVANSRRLRGARALLPADKLHIDSGKKKEKTRRLDRHPQHSDVNAEPVKSDNAAVAAAKGGGLDGVPSDR